MTKDLTAQQKLAAGQLNGRQLAFANLVLMKPAHGMSDADCYRQAGYKPRSDKAAESNASLLISNHKISTYLEIMREESSKIAQLTLERLDLDLEQSVFGVTITDIVGSEMIEVDGVPRHILVLKQPVDQISEFIARNIQEIKQTASGIHIKMYNRYDARRLAYVRLGGLIQRLEVDAPELTPWSSVTAGIDK